MHNLNKVSEVILLKLATNEPLTDAKPMPKHYGCVRLDLICDSLRHEAGSLGSELHTRSLCLSPSASCLTWAEGLYSVPDDSTFHSFYSFPSNLTVWSIIIKEF